MIKCFWRRLEDHAHQFICAADSYVVMDFLTGKTLEDFLDKSGQHFPVEVVLDIGIQLSSVLDYLHSQQPPIIFRDLKPANIMLTADNHVYLIDFGIARHFKLGKAKDTIPLGSKGYAAPEQYGKAQSTPQSDIYGLGATLHQLFTGDDPSLSLFHFEAVKLRNSSISTQLNALLKQMVEMEMSKRPQSMTVVRQQLQQLLAQQTAHLRQTQTNSTNKVGRRSVLLGFASTVAACSAITVYIYKNGLNLFSTAHPPFVRFDGLDITTGRG